MPLFRYFTYVGGALIALMFIASYVFPEPETVPRQDAARPVIRITSDRVGPPRVDFDTRATTAAVATAAPGIQARLAESQLLSPLPTPAAPALTPAAPAKPEVKKTKIARRPDRQRIAAYPHVAAYPQMYQPFRWTW